MSARAAFKEGKVPKIVRQALRQVPQPFKPAGTLTFTHPRPALPPVVILARKGQRWADLASEIVPLIEAGASCHVAFEDEAVFLMVSAELVGRQ
jgi:hypothetical protein